jgi:sporulation protein YabP
MDANINGTNTSRREDWNMAYEEKYKKTELMHNVILEGRAKLSISGVEDVESFDENAIVLYTSKGLLIVGGSDLHVEKLSLDGGELSVEGKIDSMQYEDGRGEKGGFWSRLFK